jgi:hypothetical protein
MNILGHCVDPAANEHDGSLETANTFVAKVMNGF